MHFLLIAYDGTDQGAPARRLKARPRHLASMGRLKEEGKALYGAALLGEDGGMKGSIVIYQFPTASEFEAYLKDEPYVTEGVWERIEVKPCRVPPLFLG